MAESGNRSIGKRIEGALTPITGPWTRHNLMGWLKIIAVILVLRWLVFEPFVIPSGSMEPTLHGDERYFVGDRVAVNKWVYGPRVPFMNKRIFDLQDPERWDIVVFKSVDENPLHKRLIKRVVGLPGERIHIADGKIHVNGAPVDPPEELRDVLHYTTAFEPPEGMVERDLLVRARDLRPPDFLTPGFKDGQIYLKDLKRLHERVADMDIGALSRDEMDRLLTDVSPVTISVTRQWLMLQFNFDPDIPGNTRLRYGIRYENWYTMDPSWPKGDPTKDESFYTVVPEGCYLVMGDNSPQSSDGRVFGWLPKDHIVGRAFAIIWPLPHRRDFTGFSQTWWGFLLIYVIPVLPPLYEFLHALVFRSVLIRRIGVPGVAGKGTRIFVNRLAYGLRLPFTGVRLVGARNPQRDDLVEYTARVDGRKDILFGRVAGMPGDTVDSAKDGLRVNGGDVVPLAASPGKGPWRKRGETVIPDGSYLILVDGSDEYPDSRVVGLVPFHALRGRVAGTWRAPWRRERRTDG
ncbi:MAG: signal peptidase I [bacterium]|nr:signal peptidase I [bacterium]